jgi:potassium-transporting ATPase KdpC subunit
MNEAIVNSRRGTAAAGGIARPVVASAVLFMLVAGIGYPLVTTGVAELVFPHQAQGSLVIRNGQIVGSALIGQNFQKPGYFHPRPSATTGPDPANANNSISQPYNAANSGASNLGPTSKSLIDQVTSRIQAYRQENGLAADAPVPVDAVTASGSGLDPDISVANARLQAKRIAAARDMPIQTVSGLIDRNITPPQIGVLGDPRVNVLQLNLALDQAVATPPAVK